jgi:hypothetical protein
LEKAGFRGCLIDAVEVATLKAKELGSKNQWYDISLHNTICFQCLKLASTFKPVLCDLPKEYWNSLIQEKWLLYTGLIDIKCTVKGI